MDLWTHQQFGIEQTLDAMNNGHRRILLTSPTGMGKSEMMCRIMQSVADAGWHVVLYSNRRLLVEQLSRDLTRSGFDFGVRMAGHHGGQHWPIQISSLPTERQRVLKQERWEIHGVGRQCLAIVDEAHLNENNTSKQIYEKHLEQGHIKLGVTATPLDLGDGYDVLIQAGKVSDGRACGALVPARHYGCTEPDLKHIGKVQVGQDLTEKQNHKAIMVPGIFGRVRDWFERLNPEHKPTILFGPDVAGSVYFAEQFQDAGISAANIDGTEVWINGTLYKSDQEARQAVIDGSKSGDIKVVCNRFVLREGINMPWLAHCIFATVFGSLQSYIQSGGRVLRAFPGLEYVTIQDHGGNWHKHSSLNADRHWELHYTPAMVSGMREERLRNKEEKEPFCCPQCGQILMTPKCPCGFVVDIKKKSRTVIQANGQLKEYVGDIYKPRRVATDPSLKDVWRKMYFRSRSKRGRKTFRQAEALFAQENKWQWPNRKWPFMPKNPADMFKYVDEVNKEDLYQ